MQPKLLCSSQALQMICLSLCDLHNIHTRWCDTSQIRKSTHKNQRWWKPSVLHSWQRGEWEREGRLQPPTLLFFSLWGLWWVSRFHLFLLSSCLHFWLSYSVAFPLVIFFLFLSHPLFIPPYLVLSLSQGLNLWLWSYGNIGMTTHALLCFVSLLACWLAPLAVCTACVYVYELYVPLSWSKQKKRKRKSFFFSPHFVIFLSFRHVQLVGSLLLPS